MKDVHRRNGEELKYYKIDQNGNEEEITVGQYYGKYKREREQATKDENQKDGNIEIKKIKDRKFDIKGIFLESIFPLIIVLLSIIIIKKIIKKEEKIDSTNIK